MGFDRPEVIGFSAAVSLTREEVDHTSRGVDRTSRAVDQTKVTAYAIVVGIFRLIVLQGGMGSAIGLWDKDTTDT